MLALTLLISFFDNAFMNADIIQWVITVVCFGVYTTLIYKETWKIALHDHNMVLYNHAEFDRLKWVKAAVISQLPGIALLIYAQFSETEIGTVYFLYANLMSVLNLLWDGGIKIGLFIAVLYVFPVTLLAYKFGYSERHLSDLVVYSNR